MVEVAGKVLAAAAVDGAFFVDREKILAAFCAGLGVVQDGAKVLDNKVIFCYRVIGKQPQTGAAASDFEVVRRCAGVAVGHGALPYTLWWEKRSPCDTVKVV